MLIFRAEKLQTLHKANKSRYLVYGSFGVLFQSAPDWSYFGILSNLSCVEAQVFLFVEFIHAIILHTVLPTSPTSPVIIQKHPQNPAPF